MAHAILTLKSKYFYKLPSREKVRWLVDCKRLIDHHIYSNSKSGAAVLAAYLGFFAFLSTAYTGPWQGKWDMGTKAREQTRAFGPEFASQFKIETHPAFRKD
jgi:hypothetical protein